ncbi:MAG: amino acid adenylation domain-containing protein, partial [Polyangiaceae bacterium]
AYLPLDPEYPGERLADMLADSAVSIVLGESRGLARLPAGAPQTWALDTEWSLAATLPTENLPHATTPDNLAYCIYTSGSTGKPKAAGNSHRALHNRLAWMQAEYRLTARDRVLQKTPYSFDVSVWEFFWPLLAGAVLVMAPPAAHRDPEELVRLIDEHAITTLHFVPSMLQAFADAGALPRCPSLRQIMSSGEALPAPLARRVLSESLAALHNLYGPTEAAIDVSYWPCNAETDSDSVPIGRPIANLTLHVLDAALNPLPAGVIGELYIGGVGLARGYHRRPALTAERFVPDAVSGKPGARLYRTGDLARYRADGALEYLGRTDHQVKIRGLRIELGEIESRLRELPRVHDAVVVAREVAGGKQLVGYLAASALGEDATTLVSVVRERLRTLLPEYMVPAHLLVLERLPLTASGKVDRKALPAPELALRAYVAPEGPLEEQLAAILAGVLRLERVGRDDNFFDLGGDSIVSLQVVARARQAGWLLTPRDVFRAQTVTELARAACALEQSPGANIAPEPTLGERLATELDSGELAALGVAEAEVQDLYALSPMQQGMLFHALLDPDAELYINQLRATVRGLDVARFRAAWRAAVQRHDLLRTGFVAQRAAGRMALQLVLATAEPAIEELDQRGRNADDDALERLGRAERARGFDLARPPLQRVLLVRLDDERHELIWTYHHALMDGWSSARLIEEVLAHYLGEPPAGEPARYGDYIRWLGAQDAAVSEAFWRSELADVDEPTLLAATLERRGSGSGYEQLATELGVDATRALVRFAQAERVTVNTLVQGAWALVLAQYTGQSRVLFGATMAGRPASLPGVESMLGLFINSLPLVAQPRASARVGEWLRELLEQNLAVREHEHTPLNDVQRWVGRAGQSLFDTLLVFENYPVDRVLHARSSQELAFERIETSGATNYPL